MIVPIQELIFSALSGYAGLASLVGARVYPDVAPQEVAKPYVVWQEVSLVQANSLSGSVETSGLNNHRISVTSWASGPKGGSRAREVDYNVRLAMIAGSGFKSILVDSRALDFEPDTKLHGIQSDFSIWLKT